MDAAPPFRYEPPPGLRDQVFDTSLVLLRGTGLCGITFYPHRIIKNLFLVPLRTRLVQASLVAVAPPKGLTIQNEKDFDICIGFQQKAANLYL